MCQIHYTTTLYRPLGTKLQFSRRFIFDALFYYVILTIRAR